MVQEYQHPIRVHKHTFEMVMAAYERRFPSCPQIPVVVECVITDDNWSADDSQRTTTRRCQLNVEAPYLLKKMVGVDYVYFIQKNSLDLKKRVLEIEATNETFSSRLGVVEKCKYYVHPENPEWTCFELSAFLDVKNFFGLESTVEKIAMKQYAANIAKGKELIDIFMEEVYADGVRNLKPWKKDEIKLNRNLRRALSGEPISPCLSPQESGSLRKQSSAGTSEDSGRKPKDISKTQPIYRNQENIQIAMTPQPKVSSKPSRIRPSSNPKQEDKNKENLPNQDSSKSFDLPANSLGLARNVPSEFPAKALALEVKKLEPAPNSPCLLAKTPDSPSPSTKAPDSPRPSAETSKSPCSSTKPTDSPNTLMTAPDLAEKVPQLPCEKVEKPSRSGAKLLWLPSLPAMVSECVNLQPGVCTESRPAVPESSTLLMKATDASPSKPRQLSGVTGECPACLPKKAIAASRAKLIHLSGVAPECVCSAKSGTAAVPPKLPELPGRAAKIKGPSDLLAEVLGSPGPPAKEPGLPGPSAKLPQIPGPPAKVPEIPCPPAKLPGLQSPPAKFLALPSPPAKVPEIPCPPLKVPGLQSPPSKFPELPNPPAEVPALLSPPALPQPPNSPANVPQTPACAVNWPAGSDGSGQTSPAVCRPTRCVYRNPSTGVITRWDNLIALLVCAIVMMLMLSTPLSIFLGSSSSRGRRRRR